MWRAAAALRCSLRAQRPAAASTRRAALVGVATGVMTMGMYSHATMCTDAGKEEDEREMLQLFVAAGWKEAWLQDMRRRNLATVLQLTAVSNAKLSIEPPDATTMTTVLESFVDGSALTDGDQWPDKNGDDAEKAAWADVCTGFTILCRAASSRKQAALDRVLKRASGTVPLTDEERLKQKALEEKEEKELHRSRAEAYTRAAAALYNRTFPSVGDSATLVETKVAFDSNRLVVARLDSGKYGKSAVHLANRSKLGLSEDQRSLVEVQDESEVQLNRNAGVLIQITRALESMVVAGHKPINPQLAYLANKHGLVNAGLPSEMQVNFDLTSMMRVQSRFISLSGAVGPKALENLWDTQFVVALNEAMQNGHSGCSGSSDILANASWLSTASNSAPAERPVATGASSSGGGASSSDTYRPGKKGQLTDKEGTVTHVSLEQYEKMKKHLELQNQQQKTKYQRTHQSQSNRRYDEGRDRHWRDDRGHSSRDDRDRGPRG